MSVAAPVGAPVDVNRGLSTDEVQERRARGLGNDYSPLTSRPTRAIVAANLFTRFNALLGSMFVIILVVGPLQDALFGLTLVANTAIGMFQEIRAKRTLDRLTVAVAPTVRVVRDGTAYEVPSAQLVVDDIVDVAAGDQLVVDGIVVAAAAARFDESLLTGESRLVEKAAGDRVLSGSFVAAGAVRFRVTAVGADSYAAAIESRAKEFTLARSELRDGINRILQVVTWVIIPTGTLLFWSQLARSARPADALRGAVAGTVTMVPEGLILLASVAFAVGALRLARRRVLARELPSIEGLARVDTLCIDKTGTLTTGALRLDEVVTLDPAAPVPAVLAALARIEDRPNGTARAIAAAYPEGPGWPPVRVVPFASDLKWSAADFGPQFGAWVLGAPDRLVPERSEAADRARRMTTGGRRVLLLGRTTDVGSPQQSITPVALVCLVDEIRTDAEQTLRYLREQGVEVYVLSGDDPGTVAAVAGQVGMPAVDPLDARQLPRDPAALVKTVQEHRVVGRVVPEEKDAIVNALRADGHVVAMTGDGVNDVLALKSADVGIAMGSGAAAARAVAQLVLLDDAFTAVPAVISEGRRVIANIERVANLFVTKTVYATLLAVGVGLARLPFPFLPRHLTLTSTLTIGIPAFVLALAPNARRASRHFVARVARFALPAGIVAAAATYLAYVEAREDGADLLTARSLSTLVLFGVALWILVVLVRLGDRRQAWLVPVMAVAMGVVFAVPATRAFFALTVPPAVLLLAGAGAVAVSGGAMEIGVAGVHVLSRLRRRRWRRTHAAGR